MEIFWLAIGTVSVAFAAFVFYYQGVEDNYYLLAIPVMSLVLFGLRRAVRKRIEKQEATQQD